MKHTTEGKGNRRVRKSAEERREEILEAAIDEFAARGLRGASVEDLAERVGVSQPYVYKLFGTKRDLFLAAAGRVTDRIQEAFGSSAEVNPDDAFGAMGRSYDSSRLRRRGEMLMLLQGFAASDDEEVREAIGHRFAELWRFVQSTSGASDAEVWSFMANGMLLTIDAAIGLMPRLGKEEWLREYMGVRPGE